MVTIDSL